MTDLSDLKTLQKRPQHKSITDLKSRCSGQINNGGVPHALSAVGYQFRRKIVSGDKK
jgi:hypothetical protein